MPDPACGGPSDVAPIWNPEFFGNAIVVNGATWPSLDVQRRRYRFRFLNGCNSRFLILRMGNGLPFWQIGNEGGFLPAPIQVPQLLLGPAERADVIVDFTNVPTGTEIILRNLAPDEPFGGGEPGEDFEPADPETTGQVMRFHVVPATAPDPSTPPSELVLPAIAPLGAATNTRQVSLNEENSATVRVRTDRNGNVVLDCANGEPFGPVEADLGTLNPDGTGNPLGWDEPITENPAVGADRGVGDPQLHRRRSPDPHPRDHVRGREPPADRRWPRTAPGQLGGGSQGHGDRLPGRDHAGEGPVRPPGAVRLALPHRRARGQRDDAALPDRPVTLRISPVFLGDRAAPAVRVAS